MITSHTEMEATAVPDERQKVFNIETPIILNFYSKFSYRLLVTDLLTIYIEILKNTP